MLRCKYNSYIAVVERHNCTGCVDYNSCQHGRYISERRTCIDEGKMKVVEVLKKI
jgi:hypothetical protein